MTRPTCNRSDGGHLRTSKYVGFFGICLGIAIIVSAAVLPVSPATQRFGPFRVDIRGDNCGPAAKVAFRNPGANELCKEAAQRRMWAASFIAVVVFAFGMALFAGGDERRGSMVEVTTPRISRTPPRSPGSRRYRPG
jgi:hypothetical protein